MPANIYSSFESQYGYKMYARNEYMRNDMSGQFTESLKGETEANQPASALTAPPEALQKTRQGVIVQLSQAVQSYWSGQGHNRS